MRRFGLLVFLASIAFVPVSCGRDCQNVTDDELTEWTIEGEVVNRKVIEDTFRVNIDQLTIRTDDGDVDILVVGRPRLIEVGETYEFGLHFWTDDDELPRAYLDGEIGCRNATTVKQINADGTRSDIDIPGWIPASPISARTLFLGFGALAVLTFVFRER